MTRKKWLTVAIIATVQFVNVLDFVMVMPLGPTLARGIHVPESTTGYFGGAYAVAACLSGLLGGFYLDSIERKRALLCALLGLSLATGLCAFAVGFKSLFAARFLAGLFGGPTTSLGMSIVSDTVPDSHRGRAMGIVTGAFSLAAIMGVPTAVFLAEHGGFRAPFLAVGLAGLCIFVFTAFMLPRLEAQPRLKLARFSELFQILSNANVRASYLMTAGVMMAAYVLIPHFSGYLQLNRNVSLSYIKWLYFFGGFLTVAAGQLAGRLIDAYGATKVVALGCMLAASVIFPFFVLESPYVAPTVVFMGFATSMSIRNVCHGALSSKVPTPGQRARFHSLQSAIDHASSATVAILSSMLVTTVSAPTSPVGRQLEGVPTVALVSVVLTLSLPLLFWRVERRLRIERAVANSPTPGPSIQVRSSSSSK